MWVLLEDMRRWQLPLEGAVNYAKTQLDWCSVVGVSRGTEMVRLANHASPVHVG